MKTYTVHRHRAGGDASDARRASPGRSGLASRLRRLFYGEAEVIVLVKEGMCWPALFVPVLWAVWHRLWAFAVCLGALGAALGAVIDSLDPDPVRDLTLVGSFLVLVGFYANDVRRRTLGARGYEFVGVVLGSSTDRAQLRYMTAGGAETGEVRS